MATLVYMVIAPDLGSVEFSSAGHLPPLVLGPDGVGRVPRGRAHALPLGVMPSAEYPQVDAECSKPGSTIVLYTDGLVEERGASIDRGLDALKQAVLRRADRARGALRPHRREPLLADLRRDRRHRGAHGAHGARCPPSGSTSTSPRTPRRSGTPCAATVGRWLRAAGCVDGRVLERHSGLVSRGVLERHGARLPVPRRAPSTWTPSRTDGRVILTVRDDGPLDRTGRGRPAALPRQRPPADGGPDGHRWS